MRLYEVLSSQRTAWPDFRGDYRGGTATHSAGAVLNTPQCCGAVFVQIVLLYRIYSPNAGHYVVNGLHSGAEGSSVTGR